MREIKFRAWDKVGKQWIINRIVMARILADDFPKTWELSQFIGLKDKNGREIYEGDICRREGYGRGRFEIEWPFDIVDPYELIILGNIYENPELLKNET